MRKPVLDVCCGAKMFWFDKKDSRVEFCDIRKETLTLCDGRTHDINPDTVCDFTNLPHEDEIFQMVVFDPPHLLKVGCNSWLAKKYGNLSDDYKEKITMGFSECFRVLKNGGVLIFKWNETDIPLSEILSYTKEKPLFGHRSGKLNKTHWVSFMKGIEM